MRLFAVLLLAGCTPFDAGEWDEGTGEQVPVEVLTSEWTPNFEPGAQFCVPLNGEDECCRIGVVEVVYTQAELDQVFDRLFNGARRAPSVDFVLKLGMVISNESCPGGPKLYSSDSAVHDGPDLAWNLTFASEPPHQDGPGRSFLVSTTERRRFREIKPVVDVTFF
ncbi:MAG: hypothetical protein ACI9MC_001655 [Kiritimatiellia bacterium]